MANDFMSDDDLAALEAELADLEGLDQTETQEKPDEKPKAEPKATPETVEQDDAADESEPAAEDVASREPVATEVRNSDVRAVDESAGEDELAQLEAELNGLPSDDTDNAAEASEAVAQPEPDLPGDDREGVTSEGSDVSPVRSNQEDGQVASARTAERTEPVQEEDSAGSAPSALFPSGKGIQSFIDPRQLKKDLSYSEVNIDAAFADQAALYAHYGMKARQAEFQLDQLENQEKFVYAKLDRQIRQDAADEGTKTTEPMIKNSILLDSRYQAIVRRVNEAKMIAGLTRDAAEAFKQRRDMLIQVGAGLREEMRGEMRLKALSSEKDSAKERALAVMSGKKA